MKFIGIYDDILKPDDCNVIVQYYTKHPDKEEGKIGYGFVDPELKDSTDLIQGLVSPHSPIESSTVPL